MVRRTTGLDCIDTNIFFRAVHVTSQTRSYLGDSYKLQRCPTSDNAGIEKPDFYKSNNSCNNTIFIATTVAETTPFS